MTPFARHAGTRPRRAAADLMDRDAFAEASADVGVVVGGDGFMLHTLHRLLDDQSALPLYGLNCGTVGFLLNRYQPDGLLERIATPNRPTCTPSSCTPSKATESAPPDWPSTRSHCSARRCRPRGSGSPSTAASRWTNSTAMG